MINKLKLGFKSYIRNESGATAVEYAIIVALIAISIVGGANVIGQSLNDKLSSAGASVGPG